MKRFMLVFLALAWAASPLYGQQDDLTADDLWEAARTGDLEIVKRAVESGIDVDSKTDYGTTAVSFACDRGHTEIVRFLLEKGANPSVKDRFYNATPLTWAQMKGHDEIVGLLFGAGAKGADEALASAVASKNVKLTRAILLSQSVTGKAIEAAKKKATSLEAEEILELFDTLEIVEKPEFKLTPEQARKYVGAFADENVRIEITADEDVLKIKLPTSTTLLKPIDVNQFTAGQTALEFKMNGDEVDEVKMDMFRQSFVLKPAAAEAPKVAENKPAEKPKVAEKEKVEFGPSRPESKAADLAISSSNWPGFRGNGARGIGDGQSPPLMWDVKENKNLAWKTRIPGLGNSCPTIWQDKLFVTTAVNPEADNDFRIGLYGDVASVDEDFEFEFVVYCLDKNTGSILWQQTANKAKPAVKRHAKSTHANPTVATNGKSVIAFFGSEGLYCYDMDGNLKWKKDLGVMDSGWFYDPGYQWGYGASPIIFEDNVILQCDIQKSSFVAAYSLENGEQVWKTEREEIPSWSTPIVHQFDDLAMLITHATKAARGYDARTGQELWSMRDHSEIVVPTPFVAHDLIYLASGYSPIQPIIAVRPESRGDITLEGNSLTSENIAWSTKRGGPYMPSPIVYGDYLYACSNSGILVCYAAKTGEVVYKQRLKSPGGALSFTGSPLAADGHIYLTAEDGRTLVVKAGPKFELIGTNRIEENVLTTPAISEGRFFIRGQKHIFAFEK